MTRFVSTRGGAPPVGLREALFSGTAPDGGLYMPAVIQPLDFGDLRDASLIEIGVALMQQFVRDVIGGLELQRLLTEALNFPIPLALVGDHAVIELFHGPTLAFKDIGARVMARLLSHLNDDSTPLTVLVATSGDTGAAVAHAFHNLPGTRIVVLYPAHGVTPVQEAQFATLGGNVMAVAIDATFDDCQRLAKEAFADRSFRQRVRLTSANSINIGRLLPQAIYYADAALRSSEPVIFSVPSGNFGNLTAGVIAGRAGAPIRHFIAATTVNDTGARFFASGSYEPRRSTPTLANAMDVGDPSNFERLRWLFDNDVAAMRTMVTPSVHTDDRVRRTIGRLFDDYGYVCDPHTAIAHAALDAFGEVDAPTAFLATAHPAKFKSAVEPLIRAHLPLPRALAEAMERPRIVTRIKPTLAALQDLLS